MYISDFLKGRLGSDMFDDRLLLDTLRDIRAGKVCSVPIYDYKTNSRPVRCGAPDRSMVPLRGRWCPWQASGDP
ncbi:hypothetical protein FJT64_025415 [Amphibalanus amphitrite]|uniref:Uncharacterized protein n=1 Tax=Amphibalanus amphitrite TaxID=1232801 RepID=A0A6A4W3L2_AMPAM|nr:hypothetical protein FJT64_025415 [Amphibalanus amphitrite]